jgi:hypothetical protein
MTEGIGFTMLTERLVSPYGSNKEIDYYVSDPRVKRVVPMPNELPVQTGQSREITNVLRRVRERILSRGSSNVIIFADTRAGGIFGQLTYETPSLHPLQLRIEQPTHEEIIDLPTQLTGFDSVASIGYGQDGNMLKATIIPIDLRKELVTQQDKINELRRLFKKELTLAKAGFSLLHRPSSVKIRPEAIERIMGIHMSPVKAVIPAGEDTPTERAMKALLDVLYPNEEEAQMRNEISTFLDVSGIRNSYQFMETPVIKEHTKEEQQEYGLPAHEMHSVFPSTLDDILDDVLISMQGRSKQWAKQYALELGQVSLGAHGEIPSPLVGEYGYSYKYDKVTDPDGREKLHIAVSIDGKFVYRLAFPTFLNVSEVTKQIIDRSSHFYNLAGAAEYSRSPLRNIVI